LIEASSDQATVVKGDRHHSIKNIESVVLTGCLPHELSEWTGEVQLAAILQAYEKARQDLS